MDVTMPKKKKEVNFSAIAENCISAIIAFTSTTPADACRLSLVSKAFLSGSESDEVWARFLPEDYELIIAKSDGGGASFPDVWSKKQLYMLLADRPLLFDNGTQSFCLHKASGNKCWMIASRRLEIESSDWNTCWHWTSAPESRFPEVIQLVGAKWIEINGRICTSVLSHGTRYAVYLVFKMTDDAYGFHDGFRASVIIHGCETERRLVEVTDPDVASGGLWCLNLLRNPPSLECRYGVFRSAKRRADGWQEIEMGEFLTRRRRAQKDVVRFVLEAKSSHCKSGLIVEGIEVRPTWPKVGEEVNG